MADSTTHSIRAAAGHSFALTFPANPTTGYQWLFSNPLDSRFLTLVSNEFVHPSSPSRIGQSGHQVLTFHAQRPGMTSIAMKYCRPWDDSDCSTFTFTIVQIT